MFVDERFRMPVTNNPENGINMTCMFNKILDKSNWIFIHNGSNFTEPPECQAYCPENPDFQNIENMVVSWDSNHWPDSGAIFKCINGNIINCIQFTIQYYKLYYI